MQSGMTMHMYKLKMLLGLYNKQADHEGWRENVHVQTQNAVWSIKQTGGPCRLCRDNVHVRT